MIKKLYFAAFAAAFALMGCSKTGLAPENGSVHEYPVEEGENVELTISVSDLSMTTRITGQISDESINNLQVFIFNKHGIFETSGSADSRSVSVSCTAGYKHIVALVNAEPETDVTTLEEFSARRASLAGTDQNNCVMTGMAECDINKSTGIIVNVKRLASMIALRSVQVNFTNSYLDSCPFEIKAVYLINVAGDRAYIGDSEPEHFYNEGAYEPDNSLDILYDAVTDVVLASRGSGYGVDHYFYCYPNSTETPTRLVLEAEVDSNTYYYPIELTDLQSNNKYMYDVTIKGPGKDSPDILLTPVDFKASLSVDLWVDNIFDLEF